MMTEQLRERVSAEILYALGVHARDVFERGEAALPISNERMEALSRLADSTAGRIIAALLATPEEPDASKDRRLVGAALESARGVVADLEAALFRRQPSEPAPADATGSDAFWRFVKSAPAAPSGPVVGERAEWRKDCGHCIRCNERRGGPSDLRLMVVCKRCGYKRCPHATDHLNPCTGSNAVGQSGSIYAAAPPVVPEPERALSFASMIFDRLERYTPEQRAEVFYTIENRWCWACGHPQSDDDVHTGCGSASAPPPSFEETIRAARIEGIRTAADYLDSVAAESSDTLALMFREHADRIRARADALEARGGD